MNFYRVACPNGYFKGSILCIAAYGLADAKAMCRLIGLRVNRKHLRAAYGWNALDHERIGFVEHRCVFADRGDWHINLSYRLDRPVDARWEREKAWLDSLIKKTDGLVQIVRAKNPAFIGSMREMQAQNRRVRHEQGTEPVVIVDLCDDHHGRDMTEHKRKAASHIMSLGDVVDGRIHEELADVTEVELSDDQKSAYESVKRWAAKHSKVEVKRSYEPVTHPWNAKDKQ